MLSVPFNGSRDILDMINEAEIGMFYGQAPGESMGGGRVVGDKIKNGEYHDIIKAICISKKSFNYLFNGMNYLNQEFTIHFKKAFYKKIDKLCRLGVDMITLSNPFLIKFAKNEFPHLKISLSVINKVDNLKSLLMWEEYGVDHVTLSKDINRNIQLLKKMIGKSKIKIQLIVNDPCLPGCCLNTYHNQIVCNASLKLFNKDIYQPSYCTSECRSIMMNDSANIIRANWIRPEDITRYESIGVNWFKLVDRKQSIAWIKRVTKSYIDRKYNGNLSDLMSFFALNKNNGMLDDDKNIKEIKCNEINWITMPQNMKIHFRFKPYINNRKLDGFIEKFFTASCDQHACEDCNYCKRYARLAVNLGSVNTVKSNINNYIKTLAKYESAI